MVLETTWGSPTGWAVVRDVLLVGPWRHESARSGTHRRALVDHSAERVLLRAVRCLQGSIDVVLECEPAFDYGRQRGTWRHTGSGYGQAEVVRVLTGNTPLSPVRAVQPATGPA
jgi:GH15 family glucan-1,4-alpha-glucosidase